MILFYFSLAYDGIIIQIGIMKRTSFYIFIQSSLIFYETIEKFFLRARFSIIKSLDKIRAECEDLIQLLFRLHTFHADLKSDAVNHLDDTAHQPVLIIMLQCLYGKAAVELYDMRCHISDVLQIGIAGSEIIERDIHAIFFQFVPQLLDHCLLYTSDAADE